MISSIAVTVSRLFLCSMGVSRRVHQFAQRVQGGLCALLAVMLICIAGMPSMAHAADAPATAVPGKPAAPAKPVGDFIPDRDYRVGPEDLLDITVWREEALKQQALVRPDGGISFPLIGEVLAAGKTIEEIRDEIAKRLEKFLPSPVVNVSIVRVASNRIYIIGKVNKPGDMPAGRFVDVLQALSMAGGLTPFAAENRIQILRREGGKQISI
ncbi:MAG: polysaccharide biosynthesis/export family protein, partial [Burkholderiales bacterium]|nr:polysaccharide biosynthesis/export family protein [Burkholderiales bacterium]